MIGYLFVNPGDEIIFTDKFWGNYNLTFDIGFGARMVSFNTFKNNEFDVESFQSAFTENVGKKIVLLNFPNNPAGYTPTTAEAQKIVDIIEKQANLGHEILVILDDAYFGLVYEEGVYQESLFSKLANLHPNVLTVKLDGVTKEDYAWGLRVGFITYGGKGLTPEVYQVLEQKTAGAVRATISNVAHLSQSLVLCAYNSESYAMDKQEKFNILQARYKKVKSVLRNEKYRELFQPLPYNSGYFMCVELKPGLPAEAVRQKLLAKYDTGVIAIGDKLIRIAFASVPEKDIEELFENIYHACQEV
jgi:aspartate/methionine/tyrosine aminotransferase